MIPPAAKQVRQKKRQLKTIRELIYNHGWITSSNILETVGAQDIILFTIRNS